MNVSDENEIKKEFQLERLIFFSDAVFAIIITIMILDVKLPEALLHPSEAESKKAFIRILPKLFAYTLSFCIIGGYWMRHLKTFSFLKDYNPQLIVLNLLFLFSVSLFPFALSFAVNSSYMMKYSWGIYTYIGIVYLSYFTQTLLIAYLIRNKEELCLNANEIEDALSWKVRRLGLYSFPILFALLVFGEYYQINMYIIFGIMAVYGRTIGFIKKRMYPHHKQDSVTLFSFFRKPKHTVKHINK